MLEYTSFAVSTSVFYKSNEQIDYPTVTLCNRHPLKSEYATDFMNNRTGFDAIDYPGIGFGNIILITIILLLKIVTVSFK